MNQFNRHVTRSCFLFSDGERVLRDTDSVVRNPSRKQLAIVGQRYDLHAPSSSLAFGTYLYSSDASSALPWPLAHSWLALALSFPARLLIVSACICVHDACRR